MKFHLTMRSIPELEGKSLQDKMLAVQEASARLTVPEKLLLNILKLLVIVPAFALLLRVGEDWTVLIWSVLIILLYPAVIKPIQLNMVKKYLKP